MLPELRREQVLLQGGSRQPLLEHNRVETVTQSSSQLAVVSQNSSDTGLASNPSKTRYTISSHAIMPAETRPTFEMPGINDHKSDSSNRQNNEYPTTDFALHAGEPATTCPPFVGDDLKSRLEGLRQFKKWSSRIHSLGQQYSNTPGTESAKDSLSPSSQPLQKSRSSSAQDSKSQAPERTNTKSRLHPPISFPKDFYERFPHEEEKGLLVQESQLQHRTMGQEGTPRVSPKTQPELRKEDSAVDDIEPLPTPCDKKGRPTFYETIHHFTECSHASPPANRPLHPEAQPRPDPDFHPSNSNITRSIIPGACFHCDTVQRRNREDKIIETSIGHIARLATRLAKLLDELDLLDSDDEEAEYLHDKHSARLLASSKFKEDQHDLDLETKSVKDLPPLSDDLDVSSESRQACQQRITQQIRDQEAQIDQLREEQDKQVKRVWSGFTARWGPATLGLQRNRSGKVRTCPEGSKDKESSYECIEKAVDDIDEVQAVRVEEDGPHSGMNQVDTGKMSASGLEVSRARSSSSRSRSRTPASLDSVVSARDVPGSRQPGEGKMRIGWIRE